MNANEIQISGDQAKIFARRIYLDVAAYIQSHQKEYQEFLLMEAQNGEAEVHQQP